MKKIPFFIGLSLAILTLGSCNKDEDTEPPKISAEGITANPIPCQTYHLGDTIYFRYVFTDNVALGNFNIEIHNNFDHHTHGTSSVECPLGPKKKPIHPWTFNQDYTIPANSKYFLAKEDIVIPNDVDTGDYHFMIRVTDITGFQELKALSIKIIP